MVNMNKGFFILIALIFFACFGFSACSSGEIKYGNVHFESRPIAIEKGYFGVLAFEVCGNYSQVSLYYDNSITQKLTVFKKSGQNKYLAYIAVPKNYNSSRGAKYTLTVNFSNKTFTNQTRIIPFDFSPIVPTSVPYEIRIKAIPIPYEIKSFDVVGLGVEGLKILTIGNCIDNGIFDIWCVVDIATTGGMVIGLVGSTEGGAAFTTLIATNKLTKLVKGASIIKAAGNAEKLRTTIKGVKLFFGGTDVTVQGYDIYKTAQTGIIYVDYISGAIVTDFPKISKLVFSEKGALGFVKIVKQNSNVSYEIIEKAVGKGIPMTTMTLLGETTSKEIVYFTKGSFIRNPETLNLIKIGIANGSETLQSVVFMDIIKTGTKSGNTITKAVKSNKDGYCYAIQLVLDGYKIINAKSIGKVNC